MLCEKMTVIKNKNIQQLVSAAVVYSACLKAILNIKHVALHLW